MFEFKLSLSSFRLCRRKRTSPAATHFFSPLNPKAVEIAYPITPSPPPTTPNYFQPQLSKTKTNSDEGRKILTKKKKKEEEKAAISSEESGWFSTSSTSSDGETESFDSSKKKESIGGRLLMRESLTVVKWSEKPYEDFKKSMVEMILEKEMVEAKDLEQLLQCFLSLNSRHHHADIVAAFTTIWELLFL